MSCEEEKKPFIVRKHFGLSSVFLFATRQYNACALATLSTVSVSRSLISKLSKYALCLRRLLRGYLEPFGVRCLAFDVVCLRFAAIIC